MRYSRILGISRGALGLMSGILLYVGAQFLSIYAIQKTFSPKADVNGQATGFYERALEGSTSASYKEVASVQDDVESAERSPNTEI